MLGAQSRWLFPKALFCKPVTTLALLGFSRTAKCQEDHNSRGLTILAQSTPRSHNLSGDPRVSLGAGSSFPAGGAPRTDRQPPNTCGLPREEDKPAVLGQRWRPRDTARRPHSQGGFPPASTWTRVLGGEVPRLQCATRIATVLLPVGEETRSSPEGAGSPDGAGETARHSLSSFWGPNKPWILTVRGGQDAFSLHSLTVCSGEGSRRQLPDSVSRVGGEQRSQPRCWCFSRGTEVGGDTLGTRPHLGKNLGLDSWWWVC